MSDINMTKSEEEVCQTIADERVEELKKRLAEQGIDFTAEDNSVLSPTVSVVNVAQKEFDLQGYIDRNRRAITTFSASDVFVYIDNEDIPILQGISIDSSKRTITLRVVIPGMSYTDLLNKLMSVKDSKITQIFCNDYGSRCYREFTGVRYMHEINDINEFTVAADNYLVFAYTASTPFKNGVPVIK